MRWESLGKALLLQLENEKLQKGLPLLRVLAALPGKSKIGVKAATAAARRANLSDNADIIAEYANFTPQNARTKALDFLYRNRGAKTADELQSTDYSSNNPFLKRTLAKLSSQQQTVEGKAELLRQRGLTVDEDSLSYARPSSGERTFRDTVADDIRGDRNAAPHNFATPSRSKNQDYIPPLRDTLVGATASRRKVARLLAQEGLDPAEGRIEQLPPAIFKIAKENRSRAHKLGAESLKQIRSRRKNITFPVGEALETLGLRVPRPLRPGSRRGDIATIIAGAGRSGNRRRNT